MNEKARAIIDWAKRKAKGDEFVLYPSDSDAIIWLANNLSDKNLNNSDLQFLWRCEK